MSRDSGTGQPGLLAGLVLEMATEDAQCGGSAHVDISSDFRIRLRGQGVGDLAKDEIEHQPVLWIDDAVDGDVAVIDGADLDEALQPFGFGPEGVRCFV
jgi:hypothetical protein